MDTSNSMVCPYDTSRRVSVMSKCTTCDDRENSINSILIQLNSLKAQLTSNCSLTGELPSPFDTIDSAIEIVKKHQKESK